MAQQSLWRKTLNLQIPSGLDKIFFSLTANRIRMKPGVRTHSVGIKNARVIGNL